MPVVATVNVPPGQTLVQMGDSTSGGSPGFDWPGSPGVGVSTAGFFLDQMQAALKAGRGSTYPARLAGGAVSGRLAGGATAARLSKSIAIDNHGANGSASTDYLSLIGTLYNGQAVAILTIGTNDITGGVAVGTYQANIAAILAAVHAKNPAAVVIATYIHCRGEVWHAGPAWGVNSPDYDATVDSFNAALAAAAAASAVNCVIGDFRTPLLTWEVTNNPGKTANGHASPDGIHWTDAGRTFAAPLALAMLTFS